MFFGFSSPAKRKKAKKEKTREFQTQLLHYFSKSDNKSNHHHNVLLMDAGATQAQDHLHELYTQRCFSSTFFVTVAALEHSQCRKVKVGMDGLRRQAPGGIEFPSPSSCTPITPLVSLCMTYVCVCIWGGGGGGPGGWGVGGKNKPHEQTRDVGGGRLCHWLRCLE